MTMTTMASPATDATDASLAQALPDEFEAELRSTRRFLERVPADGLNWRPHARSMTVGQLALHVADVPAGVLRLARADAGEVPDAGGAREQPASPGRVIESLDACAAEVRRDLPAIDDARMRETSGDEQPAG